MLPLALEDLMLAKGWENVSVGDHGILDVSLLAFAVYGSDLASKKGQGLLDISNCE
jgi:hypothetical protein